MRGAKLRQKLIDKAKEKLLHDHSLELCEVPQVKSFILLDKNQSSADKFKPQSTEEKIIRGILLSVLSCVYMSTSSVIALGE